MPTLAEATVSNGFLVVALLCMAAMAIVVLSALFARGARYRVAPPGPESLDSEPFLYMLEALTESKINRATALEVLTNGETFYRAELDAIRAAQRTVNLEAYIFDRGEIARRFVELLTQRARAGVRVNLLLDALGSAGVNASSFATLTDVGGRLAWYHDSRFANLVRFNNRSHRELLIVDGRVGFIGGAGVADQWFKGAKGKPVWRDTMVRVDGDAVPNLQATFCENWLESAGEILTGEDYFPMSKAGSHCAVLVVNSTPSGGGSTRARMLMQLLIASARRTVHITTPYFLPDSGNASAVLMSPSWSGVQVRPLPDSQFQSSQLRTPAPCRRPQLRVPARHDSRQDIDHRRAFVVWSVPPTSTTALSASTTK